jgi:adenylylsulfate kinase
MLENIHPNFNQLIQRAERELKLGQIAKVIWLTGLSGSGKSTIAMKLERELFEKGFFSQVLDGDNIRTGICNNLGFTEEDRVENIRRIAEVAKLYLNSGIIVICAFISPTENLRSMAKDICKKDDFIEIFIRAPLETCESRDVKGLYSKARQGLIKNFTGIDQVYEEPIKPDLVINTDKQTVEMSVSEIMKHTIPLIQLKNIKY